MKKLPTKIYLRKSELRDHSTQERMVSCDEPFDACVVEYTNLANIWHDASEEPLLEGKDIIFLNEQDEPFISGKIGGTFLFLLEDFYWVRFVELVQISKWAYISDLLPKQFGNPNQINDDDE